MVLRRVNRLLSPRSVLPRLVPSRLAPALLLLCLSSASLSALAAPSEAEKRKAAGLMLQGDKAAQAERFPEALESYRQADAIMGVPSTRVAVARALAKTGKLLEARKTAQQVLEIPSADNEPRAFVNARAEAVRLVAELDRRIPTLLLSVSAPAGAEAVVTIDGEPLPGEQIGVARQMDPGTYVVSAALTGRDPVEREVTLREGDTQRVTLRVDAPGAAPADTAAVIDSDQERGNGLRLGAYVGLGVGLVATGVGAFYAIKAGGTRDDSDAAFQRCGSPCRDTHPESANVRELDDQADSEQTISTAGFIVGAAGIATGVVLWLLSSADEDPQSALRDATSARIQPWIGARGAGVFGRF